MSGWEIEATPPHILPSHSPLVVVGLSLRWQVWNGRGTVTTHKTALRYCSDDLL